MIEFWDRYLDGECVAVWNELLGYGEAIQQEPLYSTARRIAREIMIRVSENSRLLVARLREIGYQFSDLDYSNSPLQPLPPQRTQTLATLEALLGLLPLSIRACYELIGGVSLIGSHPSWPREAALAADPLVIRSAEAALDFYHFLWGEVAVTTDHNVNESGPPELLIAPDRVLKAGYSGGPPYTIQVPCAACDGELNWDGPSMPFVSYLRLSFAWGGFPGFAGYAGRPTEMLKYLGRGLLPF